MAATRHLTISLLAVMLAAGVGAGNAGAQQAPAREHFENAEVVYDWVSNSRGERLRTYITRPKNAGGKVPVIFFVGWLSCDSMEYPDANTRDGFGIPIRRLIGQSGYATIRIRASIGTLTGTRRTNGVCRPTKRRDAC